MRKTCLVGLTLLIIAATITAQPPRQPSAAEIQLALDKLSVVGSALYIAAHPDDENTAMLAYLSHERLVRAAYLSVTRGDGGQNLIGDEKGELLGLLRTQELLAARRIDGAEQFFTRAVDFGYSKTPEETLRIWGKEKILADVVWVIRSFRPDVIITRFPTDGQGGHGHHTASALLAVEAFSAAADPARFPEQLEEVEPWQARRIFWNAWRPQLENRTPQMPKLLSLDLGSYNKLLGRSYNEIAGESRSMHKSQGFGSAERRGTLLNYLEQLGGEPAERDPFEGVDLSWSRIPGGEAVGALIDEARRNFDPRTPQSVIPKLLEAKAAFWKLPRVSLLKQKEQELAEVIRAAAGLWIEAIASEPTATPGSEITVKVTLVNRTVNPLRLDDIWLPLGRRLEKPVAGPLPVNEAVTHEIKFIIPSNVEYTHPYWLREPHDGGAFRVARQDLIGMPDNPPALAFYVKITAAGQSLEYKTPALYRWTDPVKGEQYRPFAIVPPVTASLLGAVHLFPEAKAKQIGVVVKSAQAATSGVVRLNLPPGWKSVPEKQSFELVKKSDETLATFTVTPVAEPQVGVVTVGLDLSCVKGTAGCPDSGLREFAGALSILTINYPHIPMQTLLPTASGKLVRAAVRKKGQTIGYVAGSGDDVPEALRQMGYRVTFLDDQDLNSADLNRFDAIVTGVRAYNIRERLRLLQPRLLDYVNRGGTLVLQYNTSDDSLPPLGPYPFKISRDRVTVEEAPVSILDVNHPLVAGPNKVSASDFDGWVQERGLYFTSEWDPKYQTVFESHDPNEPARPGGTLYARYGKGVFIYTSYAWFRQLPAGVPGAYRIFANMVSAGKP